MNKGDDFPGVPGEEVARGKEGIHPKQAALGPKR